MKCSHTFIHGRQSSRDRGDSGLVELLSVFEDGAKVYLSTRTYVKYSDWNKKSRSIKPSSDDFDYVNERLKMFFGDIMVIESRSKDFNPDDLRNRRSINTSPSLLGTVNLGMSRLINSSNRKSQGTIDNYIQALNKLNEFNTQISYSRLEKYPHLLIMEIDDFLFSKNLAPSTIDKLHSVYRALFPILFKCVYGRTMEDVYEGWDFSGNTKENVFLTENHIAKIEKLDTFYNPGSDLELVKDAFLLAYYTGVRYSDMDKLTSDNIVKINDRDVFMFYPQKSTVFNKVPKKAIIPVTKKIQRLLDKYEFSFPVPSDYIMRRLVKKVCVNAGIVGDFKYIEYKGREGKTVTVPMYKRVTIHTARRSAVNNMKKNGIPTDLIMRITGHKNEASLNAYINAKDQEDQEISQLLNNKYFNQ